MEEVVTYRRVPDAGFWQGRRVLITGHTGFKGGWLSLLLDRLGAEVHGFSVDIPTHPSFFEVAGVATSLASDRRGDVVDLEAVAETIRLRRPSIVFHLAAQPLVIEGYRDPVGTFRTNVMGTVSVLEAARMATGVEAVVAITTDKVYRNKERDEPYLEDDELGGTDPYSASKSGAELAATAFRHLPRDAAPTIVTARAGNVIGGGDWSKWRLMPDLLAAVDSGSVVEIRHPHATRPWQHVLDPLVGYLLLAESSAQPGGADLPVSWNFGPGQSSVRTVMEVIAQLERCTGRALRARTSSPEVKEHQLLALDSARAKSLLGWSPRWSFESAVTATADWHRAFGARADMRGFTLQQISQYFDAPVDHGS